MFFVSDLSDAFHVQTQKRRSVMNALSRLRYWHVALSATNVAL